MFHGKRVIAIIPARAGSKGVPGKNYRRICGQPLISWSIEAASRSAYIDTIAVSTNCKRCYNVSVIRPEATAWVPWGEKENGSLNLKFKLYAVQRPENLCGPNASTEDAMSHTLDFLKETHDLEFGYVMLLQPTSPARRYNLIDHCLDEMVDKGCDSAMTVSLHTPFFWKRDPESFKPSPMYESLNRPMRQDLKDSDMYLHDNGNVSVVERELFNVYGRIGRNPELVETSLFESMQIDTEEDFRCMDAIAKDRGGFL